MLAVDNADQQIVQKKLGKTVWLLDLTGLTVTHAEINNALKVVYLHYSVHSTIA